LRLITTYLADGEWGYGLRRLELPMRIEVDGTGTFDLAVDPEPGVFPGDGGLVAAPPRLCVTAEGPVDPTGLEVVEDLGYRLDENGDEIPALALVAPEIIILRDGALAIAGSISFALGVAIELMPAWGIGFTNEFIPDSPEEALLLEELGPRTARVPVGATTGTEVFGEASIDADFIAELARRKIPAVYLDVLGRQTPAVRFLTLWKTLEFAFQAYGQRLVGLLLAYPRVEEMEFDRQELEFVRALRGRLSHAASRNGLDEVSETNALAIHHVGRLWSLVDWIVISKPSPSRSLDCEPVAELARERGKRVLVDDPAVRERLRAWSEFNPRHH
jgi:hypothetical protein